MISSEAPSASRTLAKKRSSIFMVFTFSQCHYRRPPRSMQQLGETEEAYLITRNNGLSRRIVDQAISPDRRGQYARALMRKQIESASIVKTRTQKFLTAVSTRPVEIGAHVQHPRLHLLHSLQSQQEGPHKNQEGHKGRHRIAGQAKEKSLAASGAINFAERQRLTWLHGDLPHVEPPFCLHRRSHMIFLAHRNTTAGDDQIMIGSGRAQGLTRGLQLVGDDTVITDFATQVFQQAAQ